MIDFNKILYVTDLSESGRYAFPVAASIAARYNAALTVFHVVETEHFEKYLTGYINEEMWDQIKTRDLEEARKILIDRKRENSIIRENIDNICRQSLTMPENTPIVEYDVVVRVGDPVEKIIDETHDNNYDMVVMGNYGHRSIQDALMGGTARRVLHSCRVPVTIVPLIE